MLVAELAILVQRWPSFVTTTQISASCCHLASDLMTQALQDPSYALSSGRLDEVSSIFELHNRLCSVEASELAKDMQETEQNNLRVLESIQLQLSEVHSLDLQFKLFIKSLIPKFN